MKASSIQPKRRIPQGLNLRVHVLFDSLFPAIGKNTPKLIIFRTCLKGRVRVDNATKVSGLLYLISAPFTHHGSDRTSGYEPGINTTNRTP